MRVPDVVDVLREPRFRLLFGSRSVNSLGSGMADVALAFAILDLAGPTDLGWVILAREVPIVVLLLLGGVWADRLPRHLVLVVSDVVRGAAQATVALLLLLLTHGASVLAIALLQIVYGGATAFGRPAYFGLVPQLVSPGRLQQANAILGLSFSVSSIVGPALGAVIVAASNSGWAFEPTRARSP
jgi:MFS family permease